MFPGEMFPRQIYLIFYLMSIASIVSVSIVSAFIVFAASGYRFDCPTAAIFPWKCARWHFQNADCRENAGKSRPMELKMFSTGRGSEFPGLFMICRGGLFMNVLPSVKINASPPVLWGQFCGYA